MGGGKEQIIALESTNKTILLCLCGPPEPSSASTPPGVASAPSADLACRLAVGASDGGVHGSPADSGAAVAQGFFSL